jgi:opacity protein-like surface antigen
MILRISALAATLALALSTLALAADVTYPLVSQSGSGETGTVTIAPAPGGGSLVTVTTVGGGADPQPVHVHKGQCILIDPKPLYPLATLENGKSVTTLKDVTPAQLTSGQFAINVHKSTKEAAIYYGCADLTKK